MHDIAREANVALGTVSNVLNGSLSVREPVRERVNRAIETLGYEPNLFARALRKNRSETVGVLIPDITNPFFPAVVRGVEDVASTHDMRMVLCNTDDDPDREERLLHDLLLYKPAVVLAIPATGSRLSNKVALHAAAPIVCIDRAPDQWKGALVSGANEEGAYEATRYLLAMGHREIACITGPLHLQNAVDRLKGCKRAMSEQGIQLADGMVAQARFDRESGHQAALRLLRKRRIPTAIFATNDMMALGALQGIREMHLRCPEDISLVGFDNLEFADFIEPGLTSVSQPGYALGRKAAEIAFNLLASEEKRLDRIVLPVQLVIRRSVRRLTPDERET